MFVAVHEYRRYVARLLQGKQTLTQRHRLYAVAGWLSAVLGHLSLDLGHAASAAAHCRTALQLAGEVGHTALAVWVRGTQAMLATFHDQPHVGVAAARAGRQFAPLGSSATVRLLAQEARACARLGDQRGMEYAMAGAEEAMAHQSEKPTRSIFSFAAPYLPFYAGTSWVWLGQPDRAERSARNAIAFCDVAPADWPVARVLARIDLATALLQRNEPEEAARIGLDSMVLAAERPTEPVARRSAELHAALRPYETIAEVHDFVEHFQTGWVPPGE